MTISDLTVVCDDNMGSEAIYLDGELQHSDDNIFASDIKHVAGDRTIRFHHVQIKFPQDSWKFPNLLSECLALECKDEPDDGRLF